MELLARLGQFPEGTSASRFDLEDMRGERIVPSAQPGRGTLPDSRGAILYLHGGGYVTGSSRTQRVIAANLARSSGATVYSLDYRLAPEHPLPAAINDAVAAYRSLAERHGETGPVALAGDSAGGGLAVATAVRAREDGLPPPATLALICPWVDLTLSGPSMARNRRSEPVLSRGWLEDCAGRYLGVAAPDDPRGSPLFAELSGLPPMLVQGAGDDILLDDAERLAERAQAAGVAVELESYEGLWHEFHAYAGLLRGADAALARLGAFLQRAFPYVG